MNLAQAIRSGDLVTVKRLVDAGADLAGRSPDGLTPLMLAAGLGLAHVVDILLTAGAEVHAIEPRMGASALHKAAQSGSPEVIALLLHHGAFVDQQSPVLGNTALMDAVLHKQAAAVGALLDRGAKTVIRNHWQQTALDLARADGLERIASLIEARDRKDASRMDAAALSAASKAGDEAEVQRLLAAGSPVEERLPLIGSLDDDYTPLGLAAREGHVAVVRRLLDAGADPRARVGLMKGTPVHEAAFFGHAEVIRVLAERRDEPGSVAAELDAQGAYNGLTALHDAVWHGHAAAALALVEAEARLDVRSHTGHTPEDLAMLYGYTALAADLASD